MPLPMFEDVADLLHANALGIKGTNMFGGNMPRLPDFMIGLYESTGFESERAMGRLVMDVLNLKVIVRDLSSLVARTRAFAIRDFLETFTRGTDAQRVINGVQYYSILARHAPFGVGVDENNRQLWPCNYIVRKAP